MNETDLIDFRSSDPAIHAIAAKYAYLSGKMEESMEQIGYALMHDALCTDYLSLLDKIAANWEKEGRQLGAIHQSDPCSSIAVRAYLLAHAGHYTAAIVLLIQVLARQPESPFTVWAIQWAQDTTISNELDVEPIALALLRFFHRYGLVQRQNLVQLARLVRALLPNHPQQACLLWAGAKIFRESYQLEDALSLANEAFTLAPSFSTAVEVAYCYRKLGNLDKARQASNIALGYDSGDLSRRTEFGDLLLRAEQLEEGLRVLDSVVAEHTEHESRSTRECLQIRFCRALV